MAEKNIARVDITGMRTAIDVEYSNGTVQRVTLAQLNKFVVEEMAYQMAAEAKAAEAKAAEAKAAEAGSNGVKLGDGAKDPIAFFSVAMPDTACAAPMSDKKATKEPK